MDQLAATIGAACATAMKGLEDELHEQKVNHHAAIDLFKNRFDELRRLLSEQGERVEALEEENAALREAKALTVVHTSPSPKDALRKELEQLKQTAVSDKKTLQNQVGELKAFQQQQLGMVQALTRQRNHPQPLGESDAFPRHLSQLMGGQSRLDLNIKTMHTRQTDIAQVVNNQGAAIGKRQTALASVQDSDYVAGIRTALDELRTSQQEQLHTIESIATEQSELQLCQQRIETQNAGLRDDVQTLSHHGSKRATRLFRLEGNRAARVNEDADSSAHLERHDAALDALEKVVEQMNARLDRDETQVDELREELLTVTRTMLGVIKQMRESGQQKEAVHEESDPGRTVPGLPKQVAAPTVPELPRMLPLTGDMTTTNEHEEARKQSEATSQEVEPTLDDEDVQQSIEIDSSSDDIQMPDATAVGRHTTNTNADERDDPSPSKKKRKYLPPRDGFCHDCERSESARWLGGPDGTSTLCLGCGTKYSKSPQKHMQAASTASKPPWTNPTVTAPREDSISSSSTLCNYDQKEARLRELGERALKRKAAWSPLRERPEGSQNETTATDDANTKSELRSPAVKLTKTGYDLIEARRPMASAKSTVSSDDVQQAGGDAASLSNVTSKRRRMNADLKAKLMADDFIADSGSEDGKKQRRIAASKNVRFDSEEGIEGMDVDEEAKDGTATTFSGTETEELNTVATLNVPEPSATAGNEQSDGKADHDSNSATDLNMQTSFKKPVKVRGRQRGQKTARKEATESGKSEPAVKRTTTATKASKTATGPNSGLKMQNVRDENQPSDDEDCIVVARPGMPIPHNVEPASPRAQRSETGSKPNKGLEIMQDMLGSEDELALPTRSRPETKMTHPAASSIPDTTVVKSIERDSYQSLLSQFNLGKGTKSNGKEKQEMASQSHPSNASGGQSEVEARPKRAPKPRDFGDVVDLRTLKVKELGD